MGKKKERENEIRKKGEEKNWKNGQIEREKIKTEPQQRVSGSPSNT